MTRLRGDRRTALSDGSRVAKHDPRVEAYGTVDELNATLGLCRLHATGDLAAQIPVIQNDLWENVSPMTTQGKMIIDKEAGSLPIRVCSSAVRARRRPRY